MQLTLAHKKNPPDIRIIGAERDRGGFFVPTGYLICEDVLGGMRSQIQVQQRVDYEPLISANLQLADTRLAAGMITILHPTLSCRQQAQLNRKPLHCGLRMADATMFFILDLKVKLKTAYNWDMSPIGKDGLEPLFIALLMPSR